VMYPRFIAGVHDADRKFTVDDRCTSCGICAAVCPAGNIELGDGRPAWFHRCEQCMACIHLCPTGAIQAGPKTGTRARYRNPTVQVEALRRQRQG
jgi:MinD superfamily P-loop ATPase